MRMRNVLLALTAFALFALTAAPVFAAYSAAASAASTQKNYVSSEDQTTSEVDAASSGGISASTGVLVSGARTTTTVNGKTAIAVPLTAISSTASGGASQPVPIAEQSTTVVNPQATTPIEVNGKELVVSTESGGASGSSGGMGEVIGPAQTAIAETTTAQVKAVQVNVVEVLPSSVAPVIGSTQSGGQVPVVIEKVPAASGGTAGGAAPAAEVKITGAQVSATTNLAVKVEGNQLFVQDPKIEETSGVAPLPAVPVNVLPATAKSVAVANAKLEPAAVSSLTLAVEGGGAVYKIEATKKANLLWVMPVTMPVSTTVSAANAAVVSTQTPWWSFLTS